MALVRTFRYGTTKVAELVSRVTSAEKTAGTADDNNKVALFTPKDVKDMIDEHATGGVGNPAFFSRTTEFFISSSTTWSDVLSGSYTPTAVGATIGMLIGWRSNTLLEFRARQGSAVVSPGPGVYTGGTNSQYERQLLLCAAASASATTFDLQAKRRVGSGAQLLRAPISIILFEIPDSIQVDIVDSDVENIETSGWYDVASVGITPSSADAKVLLRCLVMSDLPRDVRIQREGTTVVTAEHGALAIFFISDGVGEFPSNFEDWVDEPGSTSEQTYTLQMNVEASTDDLYRGSYLMAQEIG